MVAPYPYEAVAKRVGLANVANEIYGHYVWMARWSDEIGSDAAVDLKKLAQLGFVHCRRFAAATASPSALLVEAVQTRFAAAGLTWATTAAMVSDLAALRSAAVALNDFCVANAAAVQDAVLLRWSNNDDAGVEVVVTLAKPHAAEAPVAALRALFDTVPPV